MPEPPLTRTPIMITVITPVHIGTGTELLLGYDLIPGRTTTLRVDEDAFLEYFTSGKAGVALQREALAGAPPTQLLAVLPDPPPGLFRYTMEGKPSATTPGAKMREQIKDVYDNVYLPGSTIKGALRTLLFRSHYAATRKPDLQNLRLGDPRRAAENLEREVFVPNDNERFGRNAPNFDWLRSLHVTDSNTLPAKGRLQLRTVRIFPSSDDPEKGLPIDVEVIVRGQFKVELAIDEYLYGDAAQKLAFTAGYRKELSRLAELGRRDAEQRLATELSFYERTKLPVGQQVIKLLQQRQGQLPANAFLLQLGWGTGWEDKTLGSRFLRQANLEFENIIQDYHVSEADRGRRVGDPFPKTRTLLMRGEAFEAPLGWVEVRIEAA